MTSIIAIPKQPEESVSADALPQRTKSSSGTPGLVGQPPLFVPPASLNFSSLAATACPKDETSLGTLRPSAPASLYKNRGASLAYSRFFRSFWYRWKVEEIRPNIFISSEKTDPSFNRDVKVLIEKIETNPIGKRLLEKIRLCSSEIHIAYGEKDETIWIRDQESTDAKIISPVIISCSMKDTTCFSTIAKSIPFPKHVILFHELTHAYHNLSGKRAISNFCDPLVWESDEEYKTIVGFPSKKEKTTPKLTENAFRRAEGLPERFGSWSPSGNDERQALSTARVKLLGHIHEKNQLASPQSLSPPPIALCSVSDLGVGSRCALLAAIQGVDIDFTPKDKTSTFFWIAPSNSLDSAIGDTCYLRPPSETDMTSEPIKSLAIDFFPKLKTIDFKVHSLMFFRLSQQELDVMLSSIPQIKLRDPR